MYNLKLTHHIQSNVAKIGFYWDQNQLIKKQSSPMLIPGLEKIIQISAGNNFCLALNADGKLYSWGMSEQNQLGRRLVVGRQLSTTVSSSGNIEARRRSRSGPQLSAPNWESATAPARLSTTHQVNARIEPAKPNQ